MTFAWLRSATPSGTASLSTATTSTRPGMGGMALPGTGTTAGMFTPPSSSPSGSARAPAIGRAFFRPQPSAVKGAWKPGSSGVPPETASTVPVSITSWMRHMYHMPCAKCG